MRRYEKVKTKELEFALGVGEAGLKIWSKTAPEYKKVVLEVAEIKRELLLRNGNPDAQFD